MNLDNQGIKMPSTIDIPACILYSKLLQIDKRLIDFMPNAEEIDLKQAFYYKKNIKLLTLIERNKNAIAKHFGIIESINHHNEQLKRFYWIIYPHEYEYMFKAPKSITTRLVSQSLETKITDAIYESLKNTEQIVTIDLFRRIAAINAHQDQDRHFTINSKGELTFTPKGKKTIITDNDTWKTDNRQSIKYGKGLRKIFENKLFKIEDHIIESVSNYVKSTYTFNALFQIVKGENIRKWYHGDLYKSKSGSLSQSCMRYSECQPYLDIYVLNPDKVQMLIAVENNLLVGRALVWNTDNYEKPVMDRIYGDDLTVEAFKEYARKNKWAYKKYQSHTEPNDWENAEDIPNNVCVTLNAKSITEYPYMDSFKYAEELSETLTLYADDNMENYTFNSTSGGYEGGSERVRCYNGNYHYEENVVFSAYLDEYIHEEDAVFSDYHESYLPYNQAVTLPNGDYVHPEDDEIVYSERHDQYYHRDDTIYVDSVNDYVLPEDTVTDFSGEDILQERCLVIRIDLQELATTLDTTINNLPLEYLEGDIVNETFYQCRYDEDMDEDTVKESITRILTRYINQTA